MNNTLEKLKESIIVSCQAYEGTPHHGSQNMRIMAEAAILGGAKGIRASGPKDIKAIREITDLPIVGINKISDGKNLLTDVIITPTYESAVEIINAGANVVALDCTPRKRTFEDILQILRKIKTNYPDVLIMADIATYDEGIFMAKSGLVDIISTTLAGYTLDSSLHSKECALRNEVDTEIIKKLSCDTNIPINAEGRIWELKDLKDSIKGGADMVTIGTAITRPQDITKRFVEFRNKLI